MVVLEYYSTYADFIMASRDKRNKEKVVFHGALNFHAGSSKVKSKRSGPLNKSGLCRKTPNSDLQLNIFVCRPWDSTLVSGRPAIRVGSGRTVSSLCGLNIKQLLRRRGGGLLTEDDHELVNLLPMILSDMCKKHVLKSRNGEVCNFEWGMAWFGAN